MALRDNVRFNRTKMLDEAAQNHRPTHYMNSLFVFILVYAIITLARNVILSIPSAIYLMNSDKFLSALGDYMAERIDAAGFASVMDELALSMPWYVVLVSLFSAGLMILGAIIYCKRFEKRGVASLGIRKANYALEYGVGALIGLVMYGAVVLIAYLTGSVSVTQGSGFSFVIILFFLAFVIQGAGEEILLRGYLMTSVARDYKVGLAVAFSSAVFAILHGANAGVSLIALINIFAFGIFEGIYILKRGNIFGACAIHTMWNFAQGNIFGSSVSGISNIPSIFNMTYNVNQTQINGGSFGLEGGLIATIILIVAIGLLMMVPPKKSELPEYELYGLNS